MKLLQEIFRASEQLAQMRTSFSITLNNELLYSNWVILEEELTFLYEQNQKETQLRDIFLLDNKILLHNTLNLEKELITSNLPLNEKIQRFSSDIMISQQTIKSIQKQLQDLWSFICYQSNELYIHISTSFTSNNLKGFENQIKELRKQIDEDCRSLSDSECHLELKQCQLALSDNEDRIQTQKFLIIQAEDIGQSFHSQINYYEMELVNIQKQEDDDEEILRDLALEYRNEILINGIICSNSFLDQSKSDIEMNILQKKAFIDSEKLEIRGAILDIQNSIESNREVVCDLKNILMKEEREGVSLKDTLKSLQKSVKDKEGFYYGRIDQADQKIRKLQSFSDETLKLIGCEDVDTACRLSKILLTLSLIVQNNVMQLSRATSLLMNYQIKFEGLIKQIDLVLQIEITPKEVYKYIHQKELQEIVKEKFSGNQRIINLIQIHNLDVCTIYDTLDSEEELEEDFGIKKGIDQTLWAETWNTKVPLEITEKLRLEIVRNAINTAKTFLYPLLECL